MKEEEVKETEEPAKDHLCDVTGEDSSAVNFDGRGLAEQVAGLFDLLDKHARNVKEAHRDPKMERVDRFSIYSAMAVGLIGGAIILIAKFTPLSFWLSFKNPMVVIQGMLLLLYVIAAVYFTVELYSLKNHSVFIRNPTKELLKGLSKTIREEIELFKQLDAYSVEAITYTSERLKHNHERINGLKSYFVGAIEKVGLLPGFLATIAAFVGSLYGKNWYVVYALSIGAGVMIGFYIVIVPAVFASLRMKQYGFVLEQYLHLRGKGANGSYDEHQR